MPRCSARLTATKRDGRPRHQLSHRAFHSSSMTRRSSNTCRSSTASTRSSRCSVTASMHMTGIGLMVTSSPYAVEPELPSAQLVPGEQACARPRPAPSSLTANCASACFFRYSSRSLVAVSVGAEDQVLDLDLAARFLVAALNDGARRAALVGIFELRADIVLRIAEIKLGADVRARAAPTPCADSRRCGRGRTR